MREQEGRAGRGFDPVQRRGRRLGFPGRSGTQKARPHRQPAAFAEAVDARHRQATGERLCGQPARAAPSGGDGQQRGIVAAGGMAADEDALGIAAMLANVLQHPGDGVCAILQAGREHMRRRKAVARTDEGDALCIERRRHEVHPFLVAVGPAAAMEEDQHVAAGLVCGEYRQGLVRVAAMGDFDAVHPLPERQHPLRIAGAQRRQRLLGRVALQVHAAAPDASQACSTRSEVSGNCSRRTPSASATPLAMAAATAFMPISPTLLAPNGPVGSWLSTM